MTPSVSIILLNYQHPELTLRCLAALAHLDYPNYQVIVVENGSHDDSATLLRQEATIPFYLIESDKNLGFSGGNNLGIRHAMATQAEFIWLLNNDAEVLPDSLTPLVSQAQRTQGLVSSMLVDPDRQTQRWTFRMNWWTGEATGIPPADLTAEMQLEGLTGASLLIPRRVIEKIGLLEERYFLYWEDTEYTIRARRQGISATACLASQVIHQRSGTIGHFSLAKAYYMERNRLKLLAQYATPLQWLTILGYDFMQMLKLTRKTFLTTAVKDREKRRLRWKAHMWARWDFLRRKDGPLPRVL